MKSIFSLQVILYLIIEKCTIFISKSAFQKSKSEFILKIRGDSMLDLNELEQLIAFADTGTLSKVAEAFHISTPSVTRSMKNIEEEFWCFPVSPDQKSN